MRKNTDDSADDTVQRPDLSGVHGNAPTDETHRPGEHRPEDAPAGSYTGEHGGSLPRPDRQDRPPQR